MVTENLEDMMEEEPEEDPEEEIYEEPEEDPEEEIDTENEEDPEEEIVMEAEEDPEEEIVVEAEEDPEEDPEEETNVESGEEGFAVENYLSSTIKVMGNEPNENQEDDKGKRVAVESSGKVRKSRWDLKQDKETPEIDGNNKRRKTRWDNNDSQNSLINNSVFVHPLELLMDPTIIELKAKLIKIDKKLQSTRNATIRQKHISKRSRIICKLLKSNLAFQSPVKLVRKLFVPYKAYPSYNFIGLILGPKGNTQKKMEQKTGAKIFIRGKGSGDPETAEEDLHVRIEAHNQQALDAAVVMIEKLLVPVADQNNDHKRAQLKELAKLRGSYEDNNECDLCKEQGHRKYACPLQDSTFKDVCCDLCGSFDHLASSCKEKSNKGVDPANLYVGYLPHAIDEKRLKELFLPFGKIIKTAVVKDHSTGLSKGYGFVQFEDPSDAGAAIGYMNGYRMEGKMLAVRVAGQRPAAGPNVLGQTSYIHGSEAFPPIAPISTLMNNVGLSFPSSFISSSYFSSGNDARILGPRSLPDPVSQFPGHPDYPGSQFFVGAATDTAQNQVFDFRFP